MFFKGIKETITRYDKAESARMHGEKILVYYAGEQGGVIWLDGIFIQDNISWWYLCLTFCSVNQFLYFVLFSPELFDLFQHF